MSTKIYAGFMFPYGTTMENVHCKLMEFRLLANDIMHEEIASWQAKRCSQLYDEWTLGLIKKNKKDPKSCVLSTIEKHGVLVAVSHELSSRTREIEKTQQRDPDVDFSMELSILPIRGKIMGIYYAENDKLISTLKSQPWFIDYHYQNQCDRPKNVSISDWRRREKDWDKALPGLGVPAMNGFSAQITLRHHAFISVEDVLKHIPSIDERARPLSERFLFNSKFDDFFEEMRKKRQKTDKKRLSKKKLGMGDYSQLCWMMRDWLSTKEGARAFRAKMREVKKCLKRTITKKNLLNMSEEKKS